MTFRDWHCVEYRIESYKKENPCSRCSCKRKIQLGELVAYYFVGKEVICSKCLSKVVTSTLKRHEKVLTAHKNTLEAVSTNEYDKIQKGYSNVVLPTHVYCHRCNKLLGKFLKDNTLYGEGDIPYICENCSKPLAEEAIKEREKELDSVQKVEALIKMGLVR